MHPFCYFILFGCIRKRIVLSLTCRFSPRGHYPESLLRLAKRIMQTQDGGQSVLEAGTAVSAVLCGRASRGVSRYQLCRTHRNWNLQRHTSNALLARFCRQGKKKETKRSEVVFLHNPSVCKICAFFFAQRQKRTNAGTETYGASAAVFTAVCGAAGRADQATVPGAGNCRRVTADAVRDSPAQQGRYRTCAGERLQRAQGAIAQC